MRFVAAGKFEPGDGVWRLAPLDADDTERLRRLAESRAYAGLPAADAEHVVRRLVDAVVDTMPRAAPTAPAASVPARVPTRTPVRGRRLQQASPGARRPPPWRGRRPAPAGDPLAPGRGPRGGARRRIVPAGAPGARRAGPAPRLRRRARCGTTHASVHGFGDRARTHASLALREAAVAWPPLERLLEQRVPDELALTTDDLVSLLEDGVEALHRGGVDVLWPRSLGRDLKATATLDRVPARREGQLVEGVLSGDALFAFNWQVALRGEPAHRGRDGRPGQGVLADAPAARRLDRRRPVGRPQGAQPPDPHGEAGAGRGGGAHRRRRHRRRARRGRGRSQPARRSASSSSTPRPHRRCRPRPGWRPSSATTSARGSPGSSASPRSGSAPAWPTTWGWARRSP